MQFGTIKKLNPRDIWPKEAKDFTPWLANNIGKLGQALGMELELKDMEATVGDFALDLLAKDLGTSIIRMSRGKSEVSLPPQVLLIQQFPKGFFFRAKTRILCPLKSFKP